MRYVSASGGLPGGHQEPYSAGAAFLQGSAFGVRSSGAAALDQLAGDAKLAAVFRQMRVIVGVSEAEMARRLGTNLTTLLDFEAGAVHALPPWPDTVRIVDRYAELSEIDPSPILSRLLTLMPATAPTQPTPIQPIGRRASQPSPPNRAQQALRAVSPVPLMARIENVIAAGQPPANLPPGFDGRARERETTARSARQQTGTGDTREQEAVAAGARRRRRTKRTLTFAMPIVAVLGIFVGMLVAPRQFYSLARMLPAPVDMPLRGMLDMAVAQSAPVRDGLRWIEMDDPRIRKGDKLGTR